MDTSFNPDHEGVGKMLRSEMMQRTVGLVGGMIMTEAVARSPIGGRGDPHTGRYIMSWELSVHDRGGATRDRAEAIVRNVSPEAQWVEFGHAGREPYHVLLNAARGVRI
jgi:hypothetical protein